MKIEIVKVSDLKPAEYNPRSISEDMLNKLKKNIEHFGFVEPLVINADGTVIGGHQRLTAAIALGHEDVPCVRLDLDKHDEKALNLALNKIGGEWDLTKLSEVLADLDKVETFDIELTGFDKVEIGSMTTIPSVDFGGATLLDIFNKDEEVKNSSKLNPAWVAIVSVGAFIEGIGKGALTENGLDYDFIITKAAELQSNATPEQRVKIAMSILRTAIDEFKQVGGSK